MRERFLPFTNPELDPRRAQYIRGVESTPSWTDTWVSNFERTLLTSIVGGGAMLAIGQDDRRNGSKVMTPEQLKEIGLTSDRPRTPLEAVIGNVVEYQKRKSDLLTKDQGLLSGISSGIAGSLIDLPVYSAAEGAIRGTGNWILKAPMAKNLASTPMGVKAMNFFNQTVQGAVVKGGAINALSAAVIENPIMAQVADRVGYSFTDQDRADNIKYSAFFGGLFEGLGKYLDGKKSTLKAASDFESAYSGKKPSEGFDRTMDRDRFGDSSRLEFRASDPYSNRTGRVYSAHNSSDRDFTAKTQKRFESRMGEGIIASTNREFAVGEATNFASGEKGQVVELDLKEARLLDADLNIPVEIKSGLVGALEKYDAKLAKKISNTEGTLRDIVETLHKVAETKNKPELSKLVDDTIKGMGYEGYEFRHRDSSGGFRGSDYDRTYHVFDPEKFELRGVDDQAGRDINPPKYYDDLAEEELKRLLDPSSDIFYNEATYKELDSQSLILEYDVEGHRSILKAELDTLMGELDELLDEVIVSDKDIPYSKFLKKEIEVNKKRAELDEAVIPEVIKASEFCNRT